MAAKDRLWKDIDSTVDLVILESGWELEAKEIKKIKRTAQELVPARLQPKQAAVLGITLYSVVGNLLSLAGKGDTKVHEIAQKIIMSVKDDEGDDLNADNILQLVRQEVFRELKIEDDAGPMGNDALYKEPNRLFSIN